MEQSEEASEHSGTSLDPSAGTPESTKRVPLDIIISLLRPSELEKLGRYIASYLGNVRQRRQTEPLLRKNSGQSR